MFESVPLPQGFSPVPRPSDGVAFSTSRLSLHEVVEDDADFLFSLLSDPQVMRFYPQELSREEAFGWLETQIGRYEAHGVGLWLVRERGSGDRAGLIGLAVRDVDGVGELEIGYLLHAPFWGQGYASEAARGCRDYGFARTGCPSLISLIRPENEPSRRVAQALGMRVTGHTVRAGFDHEIFRLERPD